ncbi:MAG: beta-CASP ribonuclease aCPSF1 [Candidatus Diapherotrites archaeon]
MTTKQKTGIPSTGDTKTQPAAPRMDTTEIDEFIRKSLPKTCQVSHVDFEGPEIIVYTKNPSAFFASSDNYIAKTAFELKKKISVRSDKSLLADPSTAKRQIEGLIPIEAGVKNITFLDAFHQVVIEAEKPGLVIGKGGETSKGIVLKTGWTPKILRAPTHDSEFLTGIRYHLHKHAGERKKFLQESAQRIYRKATSKHDWVRLTGLGAFREIGRSCMMVETPLSKVIMDCGIHPGNKDDPYPYLDALNFPLSELDALVISHAHMDHQGFAPYLYRMGYRGPLYCTEPTRDLMVLLQFDYVDVALKQGVEPPYTEKDVKELLKHVIVRDYREVTDITPDMRLTFFNAAHILGSASVHLHVGEGGHNILYSADMKYGFTRLFDPMDLNYPRVETMILESTYSGETDIQPPREIDDQRLYTIIKETHANGGNVLIPVFAIGRGQEVTLVIEDLYRKGFLPGARVYVDGLTREASAIHTAYPEYLRQNVQRRILQNDSPFTSPVFHMATHNEREQILSEGKAIILASSGMLNGGASLDYFYRMAEDEKNALVFTGYQGEGTLGRKLQGGIQNIPVADSSGKTKELNIRMRVESLEGYSVPYETELFIKQNGEFKLAQIGKIGDDYFDSEEEGMKDLNGVLVPAFDENGVVDLHPASHIIKHKTTTPHLFIQTKSGRSVQASRGHSVFVLRDGEVNTIKTGELKEGDYLVIPSKVPESHTLTEVVMANHVKNTNYGIHEDVFIPKKGGNVSTPNVNGFLKTHCRDMKSLARFLGYYIAEGHIDYGKCDRPTLSFGSHETETLVQDARECIRKAFGLETSTHWPHPTAIQLRINNSLLAEFLDDIRVGRGAKNKRIPTIVYNFSIENQREFLRAYFAGDGNHYQNGKTGKGYLAAKSASRELVSDLAYLLLQHGIVARIKGPFVEKERMLNGNKVKETTTYKIYFPEKDFISQAKPIGHLPFALPIKEIQLEKIINLIPQGDKRNDAKDYLHNLKKGRTLIGIQKLRTLFDGVESNHPIFQTLQKFLHGHLLVDTITTIKEVNPPLFEYDISVPGVENFIGGRGGICLHNSGHSDRNQLLNYIRNVNPKPKRIIVDHGNKIKTVAFAKYISQKFGISSMAIRNLDTIRLR